VIRTRARRLLWRVSVPVIVGLALLSVAASAAQSASATRSGFTARTGAPAQTQPQTQALERAFESGHHVAGSAVGGIRSGTLHTGVANGRQWAIASFVPAKSVTPGVAAGFQDGAATGVFAKVSGVWHLVRTGPYGCGAGLPAALVKAWRLAVPTACVASAAPERVAARRALAALPASARTAAARAAVPGTTTRSAAATPAASAAGTTSSLGQKIAAIALSQVGVSDTPVVTSFNGVDCDPYSTLVAGFSANSDGCGYDTTFGVTDENEAWCADFSKWVWEQAGVNTDMNTLNAGSVSFYDWARDQGQAPKADSGTPEPGDAIVFFNPGSYPGYADHVGIVTGVNSDGTINMANGDFLATANVHVEYDTKISLTSWAASVWGPGEEWFIVTPPATAQNPAPAGAVSAPKVAVTGTTGTFRASAAVPGGSISSYYWTFGDGRVTNTTGADVTHTFSEAGTYTVTVTITSSTGTVVTLVRDVRVIAPSSAVASAPSDSIWYNSTPVYQYTFTRSDGGLAVNSWDGGSWLQLAVPGDPAATGGIAALSYPDTANADAMTPHAYFRAADGALAETYRTVSGWVTLELPGTPAAGGAIVATTTPSGNPAVFFVDAAGKTGETTLGSDGTWTTREPLSGVPALSAPSLTLADTTSGTEIFAVGPAGTIWVISDDGGNWHGMSLPARTTAGGSLAAVTTPDGAPAVFYTDAHGGSLAEATQAGPAAAGPWDVTNLPGSPAAASTLGATTYLLPSAGSGSVAVTGTPATLLGQEAFYLTASGAPAVTYYDGSAWRTATLPAVAGATAVVSGNAYPVGTQPSELFLSGASGALSEEISGGTNGDPSASWTSLTLPATPATWADQVVLYAADPADATAAHAAAAAAGLPDSQVTTSFATAWADTLSGEYLVLAVGEPAVAALYYNVCGWTNPSGLPAGSTPFYYYLGPLDTLPGADAFVDAASDTAADTQALATDLAYYALNGALPAGVTQLPAAIGPAYACSGSPS
jgi:PKD repeat protein